MDQAFNFQPNTELDAEFSKFLTQPLGIEYQSNIRFLAYDLYRQAGKSKSADEALALTNRAEGLLLAIELLASRAFVPTDKGNSSN